MDIDSQARHRRWLEGLPQVVQDFRGMFPDFDETQQTPAFDTQWIDAHQSHTSGQGVDKGVSGYVADDDAMSDGSFSCNIVVSRLFCTS